MTRNSMRSTRLLSWRFLRWAIAIPTLPVIWWACTSHPLAQPTPAPEQQTDIYISVSPQRLLDLVFMVDNSPSMAPKVTKMNAQFTRLIDALRDPSDKTLPDLRVAVISSDLGTGCAYPSGACAAKDGSCLGDQGKFQMLKSPTACTFNDGARFLEHKNGAAVNYTGDINTVFACLASNLGTGGCGLEHSLQAFELALATVIISDEQRVQAADFLRGNAYLGLVFLTDEDDCSSLLTPGLFGEKRAELGNESASLRCATRAHKCGGQNLSTSGPGYPTTAAFEAPFADCKARTDTCANQTDGNPVNTDASGPTDCAPFKNIERLANEIKLLKADPENQILVAGLFGWPMGEPDSQAFRDNMAAAKYKIAKVINPNEADTQFPLVYDYWPVCYDPDHQPTRPDPDTGFDKEAAGWGAMGGLRAAAFIDEFGSTGLKFSICERDFTRAMKGIGDAIAKKLQNLCVDYKLIDTNTDPANPDSVGVQADCRVVWRKLVPDPKNDGQFIYQEDPVSMPQCRGFTENNRPPDCPDGLAPNDPQRRTCGDCWRLTTDRDRCPINGQLIQVVRTASEVAASQQVPAGTKIGMQCRTCTDDIPGGLVNPACAY